MTDDPITAYGQAWTTADEDERRALLEVAWAPDAVYCDPLDRLEGRAALGRHIGATQAALAGGQAEAPDRRLHPGVQPGVAERGAAIVGQSVSAGVTHEQRDTQCRFQRCDTPAGGLRADSGFACGAAQPAASCDGQEASKIVPVHDLP